MSAFAAEPDAPATERPDRAAAAAFTAATFLGAFLLFLVQPLVAKFILPWFGGGPGVWTACMLFFQTVLLAGYAYAHLGASRLSPRAQSALHGALLMGATVAAVRLLSRARWQPPAEAGASEPYPVAQILLLLAASVGLPCFALSATSPLLNAWYARLTPKADAGVYRLYAVSNAGSLLALLAYPFAVEPAMSRQTQAAAWAAGLALFAAVCGYCAWRSARGRTIAIEVSATEARERIGLARRALWLVLPACASVLLLATTNTLTHDVAAAPLLWVLPLALYLLTFVVAFHPRRPYRRAAANVLLVASVGGACAVLLGADGGAPIVARVTLLSVAMFAGCLVCHGELAAIQPPPGQLTGYYLAIAAGGAAGGVLVAVVAPVVLDRYLELHFGLWACCALALLAPFAAGSARVPGGARALVTMLSIAGLVVLAAVLWAARDPAAKGAGAPVGRWRDFYGVVTLYHVYAGDDRSAALQIRHAGVTHGAQFLSPEKRKNVTTYYAEHGGVGVALRDARERPGPRRVGVVGLGAGSLAAYGQVGDVFRFYELSPTVETIARNRFTYLADSSAHCDVVIGDARLSLSREPPQRFDVLALDAFSGHAIPVHLLTAEAFSLYRHHLAPGGVVAVHISNQYLDLEPVVARLAAAGGWHAAKISNEDGDDLDGVLSADWVLLTADPDRLADFRRARGVAPRTDPKVVLWTDDHAPLYRVLR